MKIILFLALGIIILQSCQQQKHTDKREIYYEDFKWKITIPENFENVDPKAWAKMQNKGIDAVEKTYDKKVVNQAKTIFVFKNGPTNYFESNWQPFDTATDGNYIETCHAVNGMLYETFKAQIPDATLDTASSEETIDGLTFETFKVNIADHGKTIINAWMFSHLFGKKEFSVNIMAADKAKLNTMYAAWKQSTFGK